MSTESINVRLARAFALECRLAGLTTAEALAEIATAQWKTARVDSAFGRRIHVPTVHRLARAAVQDLDAEIAHRAAQKGDCVGLDWLRRRRIWLVCVFAAWIVTGHEAQGFQVQSSPCAALAFHPYVIAVANHGCENKLSFRRLTLFDAGLDLRPSPTEVISGHSEISRAFERLPRSQAGDGYFPQKIVQVDGAGGSAITVCYNKELDYVCWRAADVGQPVEHVGFLTVSQLVAVKLGKAENDLGALSNRFQRAADCRLLPQYNALLLSNISLPPRSLHLATHQEPLPVIYPGLSGNDSKRQPSKDFTWVWGIFAVLLPIAFYECLGWIDRQWPPDKHGNKYDR